MEATSSNRYAFECADPAQLVAHYGETFGRFLVQQRLLSYTPRLAEHRHELAEMAKFVHSLAPWCVIAHHTFSWEASLWSARRVYERFMNGALPGVSYFFALEENPGRDGYHVHALWDSKRAPRKSTWRSWHDRYGRNRIEPVRDFDDVVDYCSKYVCKEGAWWDIHLNSQRFLNARRQTPHPHERGAALQGRMELFPPSPSGNEDTLQRGCLMGNTSRRKAHGPDMMLEQTVPLDAVTPHAAALLA